MSKMSTDTERIAFLITYLHARRSPRLRILGDAIEAEPEAIAHRELAEAFAQEYELSIRFCYRARRERVSHPEGSFDAQKRWYPSDREDAGDIASRVRSPSGNWPNSYIKACRSGRHVRVLFEAAAHGKPVPPDVMAWLAIAHRSFVARVRTLNTPVPF